MPCGMSNGGMSGTKFTQTLVNQTPIYDNRRKHRKPMKKHRGNKYRPANYLK
jgi:hypothetical protein